MRPRKLDPEQYAQIVSLKNRISGCFGETEWRELGMMTGQYELVDSHARLLRSLSFGDEDYEGNVLSVLQKMIAADDANMEIIANYIEQKCPHEGENVSSEDRDRRIVFSPLVFKIPDCEVDRNLISIMMPFGGFDDVHEAIKAAANDARLKTRRADDFWEDSILIQDIFSLIFESNIVVCDFTGKNPNVFYEAGIAHTLGKHVVPIAQHESDIPFDLRHHRHLRYLKNTEGREAKGRTCEAFQDSEAVESLKPMPKLLARLLSLSRREC
jgi:hypothetical protein